MTYKQKYLKHFGYGEQSFVSCERCKGPASDIHHIKYRSHGRDDSIENLIALCRDCHNLAHAEKLSKIELQMIHNKFLANYAR